MLSAMPADARALLPLKPLVFDILRALGDGDRHGWSLVREIQQDTGVAILPANFYRTLRGMLGDGLIAETGPPKRDRTAASKDRAAAETFERRRYFTLTPLGRDAARHEARRLQSIVSDARTQRLLEPQAPRR
jgi:DNA-binding PadR family transcriptional regulator